MIRQQQSLLGGLTLITFPPSPPCTVHHAQDVPLVEVDRRNPPELDAVRPDHDPSAASEDDETPTAALRRARRRVEVPDDWVRQRGKAFAEYTALHEAFVRGGSTHATVPGVGELPRRFIVVQPCCQLCNRVRVLVSALALGMLTGRAVLMDFDGVHAKDQADYYGRFQDLFASPLDVQARIPPNVAAAGRSRSLQWLALMGDFLCDKPLKWPETVVTIHGSPAFLHSLLLNPSLAEAFDARFGGLEGLFASIFFQLLCPQPELLAEANGFLNRVATTNPTTGGTGQHGAALAGTVVGLHIRNGRDFRSHKLTVAEWARVAGCARALASASGTSTKPRPTADSEGGIAFVVATESAESQAMATSALDGQVVFYRPSLHKGAVNGSTSVRMPPAF